MKIPKIKPMDSNQTKIKDFTIYEPESLNEQGARSNNEDSIYPAKATVDERLFMVCDGVGGQKKGEIASSLVCEYFASYIKENLNPHLNKSFFEKALSYTEEMMEKYITANPECMGMATTLSMLLLNEGANTAHICWIGDSRVYHIRNGEVLFRTKDHSEVQSLLDMGEITPAEAENHPRRNVIIRAVSGTSSSTRIDYECISGLFPEDFFLLCTDGVLENLKKDRIQKWFKKEIHPSTIKENILKNSIGSTNDNFSMYLIKIKENKAPPLV